MSTIIAIADAMVACLNGAGVDLLIGVISYVNRGLATNEAKVQMVKRMQQRSGRLLTHTTLPRASKVNLFRWHAGEVE